MTWSGSMLQHASTLSVDMKNNKFTFTIPLTRFSISKTICFLLGFFCNRVEILKEFLFASSSFSHPPNSSLSISLRFYSIYIQSISCAGVLTQLLSSDAISHCCLADVYISCATFLYSFSFNYKHSGICCALFKIFCFVGESELTCQSTISPPLAACHVYRNRKIVFSGFLFSLPTFPSCYHGSEQKTKPPRRSDSPL